MNNCKVYRLEDFPFQPTEIVVTDSAPQESIHSVLEDRNTKTLLRWNIPNIYAPAVGGIEMRKIRYVLPLPFAAIRALIILALQGPIG